jgi:hypothetical protein
LPKWLTRHCPTLARLGLVRPAPPYLPSTQVSTHLASLAKACSKLVGRHLRAKAANVALILHVPQLRRSVAVTPRSLKLSIDTLHFSSRLLSHTLNFPGKDDPLFLTMATCLGILPSPMSMQGCTWLWEDHRWSCPMPSSIHTEGERCYKRKFFFLLTLLTHVSDDSLVLTRSCTITKNHAY